jgi:periplasmic protein TonB
MVARIPGGLSTSALLHAGALTVLVLISALGRAPFPEPLTGKTLVFTPDVVPRSPVVAAAPVRARRSAARPHGLVPVPAIAAVVPAVPQTDSQSTENPIDSSATCLGCQVGEAGTALSAGGEGPVGVGSPDSEGPGNGAPLRVGSGVETPRKLVHVAPRYPELAQRAGLQGTVELECVIDPTGAVAEISVLSGATLLRDAAVEAVRKWRYTPTRLNGVPVPIVMTVTVRFSLRRET